MSIRHRDLDAQKRAVAAEYHRQRNSALAAASKRTKAIYKQCHAELDNTPGDVVLRDGVTEIRLTYATSEKRVADFPEVNAALDILRIAGWTDSTVSVGDDLTTVIQISWGYDT